MIIGISIRPTDAATLPATRWKRRPTITDTLTMFGPGQELRQRQHLVELVGGQPPPLLDQHPPRERQDAAEPGDPDLEETGEAAPSG
jgi:hypothetical protein